MKPAITSPSGGQASPARDVLSESLIDEMSASEVMPHAEALACREINEWQGRQE